MKIAAVLYFLFGLLALGLGIAMLTDDTLLIQFGSTVRTIFIVLLFVYFAYRMWTGIGAVRRYSQRKAASRQN